MKVSELYEKYTALEDKSSADALFSESFGFIRRSTDEVLYYLESMLSACIDEADGLRYLNELSWEIGTFVLKFSLFTDLVMNDSKGNEESDYDMLFDMGIDKYFVKHFSECANRYDKLKSLMKKNFVYTTSVDFVLKSSIQKITEGVVTAAGKFADAVENFDPSQIDKIQELLVHMNDSVNAVQNIRGIN